MAERRMLTKKVTDDDAFMSLSSSAQALYLHLNMAADDDGFCNQVAICMFRAHASVQDLEALLEKRYVYQFENGVIVIRHWRMANALRKDRYTQTVFQHEMEKLNLQKDGTYTLEDTGITLAIESDNETKEHVETARQKAYRESDLPYSFDYKIRHAFYGRECPICGCKMERNKDDCGIITEYHVPTIQHNIPISKGGKHEIGNISVICRQCNISVQDKETDKLNADEVAKEWDRISGCRLVADCLPQDRIGKDRIGQDSNKNYSSLSVSGRILNHWNALQTLGIKPIRMINGKREESVRARIRQYGEDAFIEAIDRIRESDFLQGKNSRGWTITFDWLILPSNFPKVLEGNYDNSNHQQQDKYSQRMEDIGSWGKQFEE